MFCQHEGEICAYLTRLTSDTGRAQELAQETFVRLYRCLLRDGAPRNSRAWLYRVASRLATDDYRRRSLLRWVPLVGTERDPGQNVERDVGQRLDVQRALDALSPKLKIPLVLYSCANYSVAEIAKILGLGKSAVKMRLYRAREQFRRAYEWQAEHGADAEAGLTGLKGARERERER